MNKDNIFALIVIFIFTVLLGGGIIYKKLYIERSEPKIHYPTRKRGSRIYLAEHIKAYYVHGIDVSKHQGKINWEALKHPDTNKTIDFVFIRSTVGTRRDKRFKENYREAKKNNFVCGAYHYYWSDINSAVQAKNFIDNSSLSKGDIAPVLDIERLPRKQSYKNWRKGLKNWIQIVENHYGVKPIIYSGESFYRDHLAVDSYFKNYPRVWLANYNRVFKPRLNWHFWQYTDRVKVPGIKELVDMNVFKSNKNDLNDFIIQ